MAFKENFRRIQVWKAVHPASREKIWIRRSPKIFPNGLPEGVEERARPTLYFGVDDPFELWLHKDCLYRATLAEGQTLKEHLHMGRVGEHRLKQIAEQLCVSLAHLHQNRQLPHGAIHPFNIRVNPEGRCSLTGLATGFLEDLREPRIDESKAWVEPFIAPEQFPGRGPSMLADIYSVGAVLYRLATGAMPFRGLGPPMTEGGTDDADPTPLLRSNLSSGLIDVIRKCLSQEPDQRFSNIETLAVACNPNSLVPGIDGPAAGVLADRGVENFLTGRRSEALQSWTQSVGLDPLNAAVHNNLGLLAMAQSRWSAAVESLQKAFDLSPHSRIRSNLGFCWRLIGDEKQALECFTQATLLSRREPLGFLGLALMALDGRDYPEAREQLKKASRLTPESYEILGMLADLQDRLGDTGAATLTRTSMKGLTPAVPYSANLLHSIEPPPWTDGPW